MSEHMEPIPGRIYNAAVGGHVCGPEDLDFGQKVVHIIKYDRAGNEVSFESQVTQANKIYVIHDDFVLSNNVTIPANCVLEFDGGSLNNGTLTGQNTDIISSKKKIFDNIILSGTWTNRCFYVEYFISNFTNDCSDNLNAIIQSVPNDSELCCVHNIIVSKPININKNIDIRFNNNITLNNNGAFVLNGIKSKNIFFNNIIGDGYNGNTRGLKLINASFNNIQINTIKRCKYGISFNESSVNEQSIGQNIFKYILIYDCDKGIYFKGSEGTVIWSGDNANVVWAEGNEFFGGFISKCNTGIHLEDNIKCGDTIFIGAVDCVESGDGAYDIIDNTNTINYAQKNLYISNFLRPEKVQMREQDTIIGTEYGIQSYGSFKSHDGVNISNGANQSLLQAGNLEIANTAGGFIDLKNDRSEDRDIRIMSDGNNLKITSSLNDGTVKVSVGNHATIESETSTARMLLKNNNLRGSDVGLSVTPSTGNRGFSSEYNILKVPNAGNASVTEGDTTKTVNYLFKPATNDYILFITPSWKTLYNIISRSVDGFAVSFDVAAPANASFDWIMMGKGLV